MGGEHSAAVEGHDRNRWATKKKEKKKKSDTGTLDKHKCTIHRNQYEAYQRALGCVVVCVRKGNVLHLKVHYVVFGKEI